MISRIIRFSATHRFLVILLVTAAAVAGGWATQHLALDAPAGWPWKADLGA